MAERLGNLLSNLPAVRQALALSSLQRQFDAVLPARFREDARVVALDDGELRVLCSNGAVASRLRLESQNLAAALQQRGLPVRRVSFKVQPATGRRAPAVRQKPPLPAAARQALESAATELEEGEVKAALQNLLKHHSSD